MQGLGEATLRDTIGVSDIGNGHPGANRTNIFGYNALVILRKLLIRLHRAHGSEYDARQGHTKQQAHSKQFLTYTHKATYLSLRFFTREYPGKLRMLANLIQQRS